jgi:hypothetical protein
MFKNNFIYIYLPTFADNKIQAGLSEDFPNTSPSKILKKGLSIKKN